MMRVGITGQTGFIGSHLFNYLGLHKDTIIRIPFEDSFFNNPELLKEFVLQCDTIVHLAALNRHNNPDTIYNTNITLVQKLIQAMEQSNSKPHVLFSSSIQEEQDNVYGRSKRKGREMFIQWADRNQALFTGMIIPNVFGPFGNPHYNSVIATFSHQLTHNEKPKILVDGNVKLIYINDLIKTIHLLIIQKTSSKEYNIQPTEEIRVSDILSLLKNYSLDYLNNGIFPFLRTEFEVNLFNTFRCYMDLDKAFPAELKLNTDDRGSFVETIKSISGGQVSFSTTKPGITRGNHFHTRKIERFAVIKGKARILLRRIGTDKVFGFDLNGEKPSYVDMPVWYTHNITNTGNEDLFCIFWINEFFNSDDPDTYYEQV